MASVFVHLLFDYLQAVKVFQYPEYVTLLSQELALRFRKEEIDLVRRNKADVIGIAAIVERSKESPGMRPFATGSG